MKHHRFSAQAPSYTLFAVRALFAVLLTLVMLLAFMVRQLFTRSQDKRQQVAGLWTHGWGKLMAKIMGYRIAQHNLTPPRGCLITPNHVGYADIIVLFAAHPCVFVSKADVRNWPLFGWGAVVAGIIFVNRRRDKQLQSVKEQIKQRLQSGINVVVFLEGTTSAGESVQRFHSSLLQAAIEVQAPILPVAMNWSTTNPKVSLVEDIAYWKDHALVPHLVRHLGKNSKRVRLNYGHAISTEVGACRKKLSAKVHQLVTHLFSSEPQARPKR